VTLPHPSGPPALSRAGLDRAALRRTDDTWLAAARSDPRSRVLVLSPGGGAGRRSSGWQAPVADGPGGPRLALVAPRAAPPGDPWLLGVDPAGVAHWAVVAEDEDSGAASPVPAGARLADLWEVGASLDDRDAGMLTHAVALAQWHRRHRHCPRCGARTSPARAGAIRVCEADGSEHFPRSDPAVIVLVHDGRGRCVLARQAGWPAGRVSVLAGFVEPGEAAEQAVAREVAEEVGLAVESIAHTASQPWPFPSSLMLGYTAVATPDGRDDLVTDHEELESATWVPRATVRAALAAPDGAAGGIGLPPPVSIAHHLLADWAAGTDAAGIRGGA
jgi:NAD+ diphosphatase